MRKHCGNCANRRKETNVISKACEMCITAVLENGKRADPSHWREKSQTNADRIRAMSDEELLQVLGMFVDENLFDLICNNPKRTTACDAKCVKCISEWLKQPAEVE